MGLLDFNIGDIGEVLVKAREAITGKRIIDDKEMAEIDFKLSQLEQMANQGQIEINKIEAAHKSLFVAGWRPFIGWTAGAGIAYSFVIQPLLSWIINITVIFFGETLTVEQIEALQPVILDISQLIGLVVSMLGMATLRTYEKKNSISREK